MGSLILVRHATTEGSLAGRNVGRRSDPPLTPEGKALAARLARALAAELSGLPHAELRLVTSPLIRCRQTMAAVASGLGRSTTEPEVEPALVEIDYGAWEGLTDEECHARDPELRAAYVTDPFITACPNGESGADVAARAFPVLDALEAWLAADAARVAIVVTHNHVVRLRVAALLGVADYRGRLKSEPGGYSMITFGGTRPVLRRVNAMPDPGPD
jgi:probable phosphoglycerate mutase